MTEAGQIRSVEEILAEAGPGLVNACIFSLLELSPDVIPSGENPESQKHNCKSQVRERERDLADFSMLKVP